MYVLFTSDTLVFAYDGGSIASGRPIALRMHGQRSACAGMCTDEHVISLPPRPERGTRQVERAAAARSVQPGKTPRRAPLKLARLPPGSAFPSHPPGGPTIPGSRAGEGREEGLLGERRGIPPSTERSRLFTVLTSAAGGNPRLQLLLTSLRGATAPHAPLPPGLPRRSAPDVATP